MTLLQRSGGWLLLILGTALVVTGRADGRDMVAAAGAFLAASGVLLARIGGSSRPESVHSRISAQVRTDVEERIAEKIRQKSHDNQRRELPAWPS